MHHSLIHVSARSRAALYLTLAITFVAAACSSSGSDGDAAPSAAEALESARAAMAEVDHFQFELTHPQGSTALPGGLSLRRAEGATIRPDRLSVKAEADLGRVFVRVDAVIIGDQTWMTNPLTGNWAPLASEDSPFNFLDVTQLVVNLLGELSDVSYPAEGPAGSGPLVLEGNIPAGALSPLVGTVQQDSVLSARLVVDRESFVLTEARVSGKLQPSDEDNYVRLFRLSGFDAQTVIEPPI
jgi:hypothetical protein